MAFDGLVALASPGFDLRNIQELNVAPAVFDETGLLESPGNKRYAAATDPEHLRKEFLGKLHLVATPRATRTCSFNELVRGLYVSKPMGSIDVPAVRMMRNR